MSRSAGDELDPWPSPARGWTIVVLLALASMASQFDRTVVNLMVEPIKAQFDLDDTRFAMLQGFAFGLFYILACVPIGRLVDRYSRTLILGICLALFSVFAMASGLARTYGQLFLTRVGVGVGEASVTPAAMSMISDLFPPSQIGRPASGFLMSAPIGQAIAFIGGGSLLQWLTESRILTSGLLAGLEPWQAAFILIGAPGLLLAPVFLLLREPRRRGPGHASPLPVAEVVRVVRTRSRALVPMFAGFALVSLVSYAFFIWTPALFQRVFGWSAAQVGLGFGLVLLVFGTSGVWFAGWASDRLARTGRSDALLTVAAFGFIGCGLFGALAPLMPTAPLALGMLGPAIFLSMMPYPCAAASIQLIVPNRARGQVTALYITLTTLVGLAIGPVLVGLLTDHVFQEPADIRYSLALVVGVSAPLMFLLILAARPHYRRLREQPH
jgi:MFS family permease